jgi:hypothetical protein
MIMESHSHGWEGGGAYGKSRDQDQGGGECFLDFKFEI